MAAYTAAVKRAKEKYEAKAYDRLSVVLMKGKKEAIRQAANATGVSVNAWISQAIDARLEKEGAEG